MENKIKLIKKRNGELVEFTQDRIANAIFKAITAANQGDGKKAKKISDKVVEILNRRFKLDEIPQVEQIQDLVEEVLILEGLVETAKAYILYREQRRKIREAVAVSEEAVGRVDQYLEKLDWEVQENANMAFSLQGLNHYGVSYIVKKYWLNKIYPKEIREANEGGDLHIHNLDTLGPYCVGWDLYDLLLKGFGGIPGKVETKPAKHFRVALGQVVNFMYTLQGEAAGAIAFSNFDTLLAPFIRYDNLNYQQVKQAMQEFLFNMSVPTRVGFQCISQDTEILTPEGWKAYDEVEKGDEIKTLNQETKEIENKKVKFVFKREYKGIMYRLKNRIQDQLISPEHRVLRKKFNTQKYVLEPIEKVLKLKSPIIIPIAGKNTNPEVEISDEQIKLMAWIISEGTIERPGKHRCCYRVSIYQSKIKNRTNYNEIVGLLKRFNLEYSNHPATSLGEEVQQIRLNAENSREIHGWFGSRENVHFIPEYLLNLSERQSRLFLETYLRGDGKEGCKIVTSDLGLLDDLERVIVNAGYGFTIRKQKPILGAVGKKDIYILRIIRHPETYITKIRKVNYKGIIWCPHTENGTVIARRKGKVFITGNCPFTNITLDLKPSPVFAKQPIIIGGKPQNETYEEFEEEMKIFNRAFYETMLEGDKSGRPFSFPIPTINITKDFPWDEPAFNGIFEASAKYGINYFANYINSEMKPEDVRSMCKLPKTEIIYKNASGEIAKTEIRRIVDDFLLRGNSIEVLVNGKFEKVKNVIKLKLVNEEVLKVTLDNGIIDKMTFDHPSLIIKNKKLKMVESRNLKVKDEFPFAKYSYEGELGDFNLGRLVGLYIGDGWISHDSATFNLVFDINENELTKFVQKIAEERFVASTTINSNKKHHYVRVSVASRGLVETIKEYVREYGSLNKRLNSKLFARSIQFRKGVLIGIIESDGFISRERNYAVLHLGNKDLILDILMLARSLGINTTYFESKNKTGNKEKIGYNLRFAGDMPDWLKNYLKLKKGNNLKYRDYGDFYGVKIVKIEKEKYTGYVYDFEIDSEDHAFQLSNGIITHNCCRLRLNLTELYNRGGGGLFGSGSLTGSIGVVTCNLPRIGYLSKTKKEFFERLGKMMDLAKESLEIKRKTVENFTEKGLYPYSRYYLSGIKKARGNYWGNHFSTIGLVGMNEALLNFIGENVGSKRGRRFGIEILDFMREKLVKYQKETGNIYNLEATPAESTAYRLAQKDKEKYPEIITAGTKKVPFYTNSSQLPVNYTDDIFGALKLQDEPQCRYSGGTVLHLFLGERVSDIQTVKNLIKRIFEKFHLPYITITPTFSICPVHGYIFGEHFYCPQCTIKQPCEVYSRVVGYLRPVSQWNTGKQEEFKERKEFKIRKAEIIKI